MRITAVVIAGALAFTPHVRADCSIRIGATRTQLIELHTSEGCSSCPPADRWLNALPSGASSIALAFHVDYRDSPNWSDRVANPWFTQRQQALAAQFNSTIVYTPEVAFDGHEWRSRSGAAKSADKMRRWLRSCSGLTRAKSPTPWKCLCRKALDGRGRFRIAEIVPSRLAA